MWVKQWIKKQRQQKLLHSCCLTLSGGRWIRIINRVSAIIFHSILLPFYLRLKLFFVLYAPLSFFAVGVNLGVIIFVGVKIGVNIQTSNSLDIGNISLHSCRAFIPHCLADMTINVKSKRGCCVSKIFLYSFYIISGLKR